MDVETKKKKKPAGPVEKIILTREEKEAFSRFLSSKFGEKAFLTRYLATANLAKARGVVRSVALKAKWSVRCLEHRATFADILTRAADLCQVNEIRTHLLKLENAAKGSRKILQKKIKLVDKGDFRRKHKKHQSRHY